MNCKILFCLFVYFLSFLPGQIIAQDVPGQGDMQTGDSLSGFVDYDKNFKIQNPDFHLSRLSYFKASQTFLLNDEAELFVEAWTRAAWTYMSQNEFRPALVVMDSILNTYPILVDLAPIASINLFHSKAWSHLQIGQIRPAYQAYNQMLAKINLSELDPHPKLHKAVHYHGLTARQLGYLGQAKRDFLAVLKLPGANLGYISSAYNSLGLIAKQSGDYESAIRYYNNALISGRKIYAQRNLAPLYNNLGNLYIKMGKMVEAKKYLSEGIQIVLEAYGEKYYSIHNALYNSTVEYYMVNKDLDSALYYASLSLNISEQLKDGKENIARGQLYIATIYFETGKHQEASSLLEQIDQGRHNGYKFPSVIDTKYYLLKIKLAEKDGIEQQLSIMNSALKNMYGSETMENIKFSAEVSKLDVVKLLQEKARLQKKLYLQNNNLAVLKASLATSNLAIDYTIIAYDDLFFGNGKNELAKASKEILEMHLETLDLMAQQDESALVFQEVLKIFELNKSNQLLEALVDAELFGVTEDPLLDELTTIDSRLREAQNNKNDSLIVVLTLHRETVLATIEQEMPAYYEQKFNKMQPDARQLQEKIGKEAMLLEYFIGPNYTYSLSIIEGQTHFKRLGETTVLLSMVNSFLAAIESHDFSNYAEIGPVLYAILIGLPPDDLPENIVVIPDGFITSLPFATLPIKVGEDYRQTQYLIHKNVIRYHYSSTLLIKEPTNSSAPKSLIAYAPMAKDNSKTLIVLRSSSRLDQFVNLPATAEEAQNASTIMSGEFRLNELATEEDFKMNAGHYRNIHLATHNLMDPFNANSNALVFADDENSAEDGFLTLYEVQEMGIKADLVTLSACNTGLGAFEYGEGVMSMARGFLFAGTKNVVMSLWTVNDNSTARLMENFYNHHSDNKDVAMSLTLAKRNYLQNADEIFSDPYYWGAWVTVGPLEEKQGFLTLFIALGLSALGLMAYKLRTYFV